MAQEIKNFLVRQWADLFRPPRSRDRNQRFAVGRWLWALGLIIAGVGLFYFLTTPPPNPNVSSGAFAAMGSGSWASVLLRSAAELLPENMATSAGFLRLGSGVTFAFGLIASLILVAGRSF